MRSFLSPTERHAYLWLLPALLLPWLMPTGESLWLDEMVDAGLASKPTLTDFIGEMRDTSASQGQMPLGLLVMWAWEKVFGDSEFALRAINILWVSFGTLLMWDLGRRRCAPFLGLVFACSPFVWYYANEARPFALQVGLSAFVLWAFVTLIASRRPSGVAWLIAATLLLAASSIINYVLVALVAAFSAVWWLVRRPFPIREVFVPIMIGGFLHLGLAALLMGSFFERDGSQKIPIESTGLLTLAYALYEITGFFGFGPGRQELREALISGGRSEAFGLMGRHLATLTLLCIPLVLVVGGVFKGWRALLRDREWTLVSLSSLCFVVIVFLTAWMTGNAMWGRHLSAVIPWWCFFMVVPLRRWGSTCEWKVGVAGLAVSLVFLVGGLRIRCSQGFRKENHRAAVEQARQLIAQGGRVLWAAPDRALVYYRLEDFEDLVVMEPGLSREVYGKQAFEAVFICRPELCDPEGIARSLAEDWEMNMSLRWTGYTLFTKVR